MYTNQNHNKFHHPKIKENIHLGLQIAAGESTIGRQGKHNKQSP